MLHFGVADRGFPSSRPGVEHKVQVDYPSAGGGSR